MHQTHTDYNKYLKHAFEMRNYYNQLSKTAGTADILFSVDNFEIPQDTDQSNLAVRLYTPTETPTCDFFPIVLFVHGGGWISGNLDTHDVLARALSLQLNALVLAVDYRLAPEADALQQIADIRKAFDWLYNNAERLKGNKKKIIAIGDSAGGALIANLANQLKKDDIFAQWLMYPALGFDLLTPSAIKYGTTHFPTNESMPIFWQSQLPEGVDDNDPRISPIFAEVDNMPATLISVAGLDPLTSMSEIYMQRLLEKGITAEIKYYQDSEHGFIQFFKDSTNHPFGEKAFNDGIAILKAWLKA